MARLSNGGGEIEYFGEWESLRAREINWARVEEIDFALRRSLTCLPDKFLHLFGLYIIKCR